MPVPTNRPPFQPSYPGVSVPAPVAARKKIDLISLLKVLKRRALTIGGATLTITAATLAWTVAQTPVYRGEFRVLIEPLAEAAPEQGSAADRAIAPNYQTQIEVIQSQTLLSPVAQALQEEYPDIDSRILAANLSVDRVQDTKILVVSYRNSDPDIVQAVLSELEDQVLEYSFEQSQASLTQGVDFVEGRLPELRDRVDNLQDELEQFRRQYNLFDPELRGADLSELLSTVQAQRQALQTELAQARSLFQTLQGQLSATPSDALASATLSESPRYQSLLDQIKDLETQIAVDSARYQPDSPQMEALREKRDNLLPLLEEQANQVLGDRFAGPSADSNLTPTSLDLSRQLINIANQIETLQARSQSLAQAEQSLKVEFESVPARAREYSELQRELQIATQNLNRFLETRETLQIDAAQSSVPWELIARPQTSNRPVSPNMPLNLGVGAIAGLLLGTAAALLMEKLDQVFHAAQDLKSVTRLPVLGTIPHLPHLKKRSLFLEVSQDLAQSIGQAEEAGPAHGPKRQTDVRESMFLEAFRSLHTSIRFLQTDKPLRSAVVTSATPGEGKSTIAAGLAHAAAAMGQRVLLVDADLRAPRQHSQMGLSNYYGLSNIISESADVSTAIQQPTADPNLAVLTSGPLPSDPARLLSSQRMQDVMVQLHRAYDFVIYDTPPASGFADSRLVAAYAGGLILAVGLGKAERSLVEQSLERLERSPISLLGVVANGIKQYTTQGDSGYYQHYQSPAESVARPAPPKDLALKAASAAPLESTAPLESSMVTRSPTVPAVGRAPLDPTPAAPAPIGKPPSSRSIDIAQVSDPRLGWRWFAAGLVSVTVFTAVCSLAVIRIAEDQATEGEDEAIESLDSAEDLGELGKAGAASPPPDAADPSAEPEENAANAVTSSSDGAEIDAAEASPTSEADPFSEAVQIAQDAAAAGSTAQTPQEWSQITTLWQRASVLMSTVPQGDPRFDIARDRAVTYRSNGEYARQRTLSLQVGPQ
ncbi:MAG: polysaccharide biosynthesis tyrosine autokinase [Elainellaceae cyanobacterium]